jgi:hypothetical protein
MLLYIGFADGIRRSAVMNELTKSIIHDRKRALYAGWSNDCIWISSSFTIPEPPAPMNPEVTRPRPVWSGTARMPPRSPPIASISSMNPIAPPSLRASLRRRLKKPRILAFVIPNHIDWNAGAEMNRKGTPACFAIALAR